MCWDNGWVLALYSVAVQCIRIGRPYSRIWYNIMVRYVPIRLWYGFGTSVIVQKAPQQRSYVCQKLARFR